ncbi:putative WD40-repeat-containing domain-containing protein [Heracleum sosnowskyi]|uniref:WD40-repeat-containing domain-containing protein n=1 Tax=Heracleum sosnowskyi TaxID=360622 RepID=A0AAD8IQX3_9APIA|nr:putative WD40-repeat-containing domain-containing protein [Heracleum sosnowskyi]
MALPFKGKSFSLYFLLIFNIHNISSIVFADTSFDNSNEPLNIISHTPSNNIADLDVFNQQQVQIKKLEEVVKNLTHLVLKLESLIPESIKIETFYGKKKDPIFKKTKRKSVDGASESNVRDGEISGAVSITKHSLFWSERFQFVSAVKLDSIVTCVSVLPFKDLDGISKYVAVGNDQGKVFVFSRNGNVLLEFSTLSDSPVTAILSYMSSNNQSVLVTGHENGIILRHSILELLSGEEGNSLVMENDKKFAVSEIEEGGSKITILEVHHVGRTRYIISTDDSGKIKVFKENGSLHGLAVPMSRPLVFLKQKLLFLTETGAGSLDLRTMKILESGCEGLNYSYVRNYVFDATERSKAYGFTSEGELIHLLLLGDTKNFKCRVRSIKKLDMDEPLAIQTIKGYLLVSNREKVDLDVEKDGVLPLIGSDQEKLVVLNLGSGYVGVYRSNLPIYRGESSSMIWGTPLVIFIVFVFGAWKFFANKKEAYSLWGPEDPFTSTSVTNGNEAPLVSNSGERSFMDSSRSEIMDLRGSGLRGPSRRYGSPSRYTGAAENSFRPNSNDTNSNSRPASVDPNYRPTTYSTETNSRHASVDPNYRAASELKFRPKLESAAYSSDTNSIPSSVDPNYRAASELKYRPNVDSTTYSHRRESLYGNRPVGDDST